MITSGASENTLVPPDFFSSNELNNLIKNSCVNTGFLCLYFFKYHLKMGDFIRYLTLLVYNLQTGEVANVKSIILSFLAGSDSMQHCVVAKYNCIKKRKLLQVSFFANS